MDPSFECEISRRRARSVLSLYSMVSFIAGLLFMMGVCIIADHHDRRNAGSLDGNRLQTSCPNTLSES